MKLAVLNFLRIFSLSCS